MCVLRATGKDFDPETFLRASSLEPCRVFRRGEPRIPASRKVARRSEVSGFTVVVSDAPWTDLPGQVEDAEGFLQSNRSEIERLASCPGVTDLVLDFPLGVRMDDDSAFPRFDRFPAAFVRLAGELGIALELSTYPVSGE